MNKIIKLILILLIPYPSLAQDTTTFKKNFIFVEGLGNAGPGLYSINFERQVGSLKNEDVRINLRLGGVAYRNRINGSINEFHIPLLINFISGIGKNHFEQGYGFSFEGIQYSGPSGYTKKIGLSLNYSYRYQKPGGHFLFRAGYAPTFYLHAVRDLIYYLDAYHFATILFPELSIGFCF